MTKPKPKPVDADPGNSGAAPPTTEQRLIERRPAKQEIERMVAAAIEDRLLPRLDALNVDAVAQRVLEAMTQGSTRVPLIEWEFRYRHAKGLATVRIRTFTEQEQEARAVAMKYLEQLASPNVKFVYTNLACVATTATYPELAARFGKAEPVKLPTSPVPAGAEDLVKDDGRGMAQRIEQAADYKPPVPAAVAPNPPGFEDMDDGMSGPALPADQVRGARRLGT